MTYSHITRLINLSKLITGFVIFWDGSLKLFFLLPCGITRRWRFALGWSPWQSELQRCLWGLRCALWLCDTPHVGWRHLPPSSWWLLSLPLLGLLRKMSSRLPPHPPCHCHLLAFLSWAGWWWQAELVTLMPSAIAGSDKWQRDLRTVGSAGGDGSTPNFSLFHGAMAVDVWQRVPRRDLKLGFS